MRQLRDRHSTQYRRRSTGELKEEEEEEEEYECEETALDKGVIRQFYPFSSENRVNQPSGTIFCCYNSLLPHNCAGRNVAELPLQAATVACRPRQSLIYMYLRMQSRPEEISCQDSQVLFPLLPSYFTIDGHPCMRYDTRNSIMTSF